jgi:hypothetical protein
MNEHDVLERARQDIRPSTLEVDDVYRRRGQRQARRRVGAAATALLLIALAGSFLFRSFEQTAPAMQGVSVTPTPAPPSEGPAAIVADFPTSVAIRAVAAQGTRFAAVGIDSGRGAAAWYSRDGRTWERASVTVPDGGVGTSMLGAVEVGTGFLAWGTVGDDGYVWRSADGRSWSAIRDESPFGGPGVQSIAWMSTTHFGLQAGGRERSGTHRAQPIVWNARPSGWERMPSLSWAGYHDMVWSSGVFPDTGEASNELGAVSIDSSHANRIAFTPSTG